MIELRELFSLLRASAKWIMVAVLVGIAAGSLAAAWDETHPSGTILVSLQAQTMDEVREGDISYDGYYII